jgi:large subunit ribosomal protein L29
MQIHEIRAMTDQQLQEELVSAHRELMNLRFRAATNQLTDTNMPSKTRRDIARLRTVIQERGMAEA